MSAPCVLAVSPHLDDAAFSAGGTLWQLARAGVEVVVLTAFTATMPSPKGFALACQLDKGLGPDVDYMALRRAEDAAAQAILGTTQVHLSLPEAPHRGYDSAPALFGPALPADKATEAVVCALETEMARREVALVLGPQALGGHVDHRHVTAALRIWAARQCAPLALWRDAPYVVRVPEASHGTERAVVLTEAALEAKARACGAYASQLGFQFGDARTVPATLRELAYTDARRLGLNQPIEAFVADPMAAHLLSTLGPNPIRQL